MTIAACHICPEGVILGTDSTSTVTTTLPGGEQRFHYRDYEQKLFEVGSNGSSIGLATWGMGRLGKVSHRTIAAEVGEAHRINPCARMRDIADLLAAKIAPLVRESAGAAWDDAMTLLDRAFENPTNPEALSAEEWKRLFDANRDYAGGYFLGGRVGGVGVCQAFEVKWSILDRGATVAELEHERPYFRGIPEVMQRLVLGYDERLVERIVLSGKWSGTQEELMEVLESSNYRVKPDLLPLRDAIDWVHTVIHTTIRAIKFSGNHFCGGPVEIAAITTDRPFRWVCHKGLDVAIITAQEGQFHTRQGGR